ncbi:Retrovirus-related Pol polyprotein, partial [Fragariocoptes setiger]
VDSLVERFTPLQIGAIDTIRTQKSAPLLLKVMLVDEPVLALCDTGAVVSVATAEMVARSGLVFKKTPMASLRVADTSPMRVLGVIRAPVTVVLNGEGRRWTGPIQVVDKLSHQLIIGRDILKDTKIINCSNDSLTFVRSMEADLTKNVRPEIQQRALTARGEITLPPRSCAVVKADTGHAVGTILVETDGPNRTALLPNAITNAHDTVYYVGLTNFTASEVRVEEGSVIGRWEEFENEPTISSVTQSSVPNAEQGETNLEKFAIGPQLTSEQRGQITELLIKLLPEAEPAQQPMRRYSPLEKAEINRQMHGMLEEGIIEKSNGPWASPIVLVRKKDGTLRFCVDFRQVNARTKAWVYPLPRIDEALEQLRETKYFSSLDLVSGYWQVTMADESKEVTAFRTAEGHYQFRRMPFGLRNAGATFQALMDAVLGGLKGSQVLVYLDDVIIATGSWDEHLVAIEDVLLRFRQAELKLKPSKCLFGHSGLKFLGHFVDERGVHADPSKTDAIRKLSATRDVSGIRRFLGMAGYYRRFIANFATIAQPLSDLTKKDSNFMWGSQQQAAFDALKEKLISAPILAHFRNEAELQIKTDASLIGLGAVLLQKEKDGWHPIAYASRCISRSEGNLSATELEGLGMVWAVEHYRPYILGKRVEVVTDHTALWEFDLKITYSRGRTHHKPDCLSRAPVELDDDSNLERALVNTLNETYSVAKPNSREEWLTACSQNPSYAELANARQVPTPDKK